MIRLTIFCRGISARERMPEQLKNSAACALFALNLIEWHVIEWIELPIFFIGGLFFNLLKGVITWQPKHNKAVTQ
jgi:hypothetical protein